MNRLNQLIALAIISFSSFTIISCEDDDDKDTTPTVQALTQTKLDAVTNKQATYQGSEFGADSHNGTGNPGNTTVRDIYTSFEITKDAVPGDIITKRVYSRDTTTGAKGDLLVTFAMFKREAGYNTGSGDWEWLVMPNDGSANYTTNPNGVIPTSAENKGKLANCIGCHQTATSKGGKDLRFVFAKN